MATRTSRGLSVPRETLTLMLAVIGVVVNSSAPREGRTPSTSDRQLSNSRESKHARVGGEHRRG
jgi:hypothetical protein